MTATVRKRKRTLDLLLSALCVGAAIWLALRNGWTFDFSISALLGLALAQGLIYLQWLTLICRTSALLSGWRLHLPDPALRRSLALSLIAGYALFGAVGQMVSRVALFVREGVSWPAATLTTLIDRLLQLLVLGILCSLSIFCTWLAMPQVLHLPPLHISMNSTSLVLIAGFLPVLALALAVIWKRVFQPMLRERLDLRPDPRRVGSALLNFLLWSSLGFGLHICAALVLLHPALGDVHLSAVIMVVTLTMLFSSLPISIGGWGVRELVMVVGLGQIGIDGSHAILASVALGVMSLLPAIPTLLADLFSRELTNRR